MGKENESYERHYEKLVVRNVNAVGLPNREAAFESWRVEKRGENWRIELEQSRNSVIGLEALRQFEVRQKSQYELNLPEMSKVTRDLIDLRKSNH